MWKLNYFLLYCVWVWISDRWYTNIKTSVTVITSFTPCPVSISNITHFREHVQNYCVIPAGKDLTPFPLQHLSYMLNVLYNNLDKSNVKSLENN